MALKLALQVLDPVGEVGALPPDLLEAVRAVVEQVLDRRPPVAPSALRIGTCRISAGVMPM